MGKKEQTEFEQKIFMLEQEYEKKLEEQKDRILQLKEENESYKARLDNYSIKDESISRALVLAVEKAKELENSSKNLYELEIQRIRILYSRWEQLLDMIIKKYPNVKAINEINNLIEEFNESIAETINSSFSATDDGNKAYVKNLLNRMNGYVENRTLNVTPNKQREESELKAEEPADLKNLQNERTEKSIIKPVANINLEKDDKYDSVVDKFLNDSEGEEANTAYAKRIAPILNQRIEEKIESYINAKSVDDKFDLAEAVCPKETLEEIMKAFDFYPDNNTND